MQPSMGGTSLFVWLEPWHVDKEAAYHILNRAQNNVGLVLPGMQCEMCIRDSPLTVWNSHAASSTVVKVTSLLSLPLDRKSTRLNSSHSDRSRMPSSA